MKVLRRGTFACISSKQKAFIFLLSCLFIFASGELRAKPLDCDQFRALFGLVFSGHRIAFSAEQIYSLYQNSLTQTIKDLDPDRSIFMSDEINSIVGGITAESFSKCQEIQKIEVIYSSRSTKSVYSPLSRIYEMDMANILSAMDPHSNFFASSNWQSFKKQITGKMKGLGINFTIHDDFPMISKVIKGSPAHSVLLPGDLIIEINGLSTRGLTQDNFSNILKSADGTLILIVKRADQTLTIEIEKKEFNVPSVEWKFEDYTRGILYVRLEQFSERSFKELETALIDASNETYIRGLMLDLRYNPGGLLSEAKQIASLFLENDIIATIVDRQEEKDLVVEESPSHVEREIPIALLINNFSASASELLAQTMRDYQRAMIVGTNSFGKGTGQSVLSPEVLSKYLSEEVEVAITLTTFQFYSPFGNSPQKYGVSPHITVSDERLDQKIAQELAKASKEGRKIILREADYDNALPVNVIDNRLDSTSTPTNNIDEIKSELEKEVPVLKVGKGEEIPGVNDKQYDTALNYLSTYVDRCGSYHMETCSFGGQYASSK